MSNSFGGCNPLDPPSEGSSQPIRSLLYELARDLSPEDYRGIEVPIVATLGPIGGSMKTVSYRVPNTHNLIVKSVVGQLALTDIFNEVLAVKNGSDATKGIGDFSTAPDVIGRLLMKAMNCEITLKNADRQQPLIDNGKLNLSTVLTMTGGRPIDWAATPHIVPAGETLEASISLINFGTTGDVLKLIGGDTEYGLVLSGVLVRVKRS